MASSSLRSSTPSRGSHRGSTVHRNPSYGDFSDQASESSGSHSLSRRPTMSGLPHTLIHQPSSEQAQNSSVKPTCILYNRESAVELSYISVDSLSSVPNDRRLWINVDGVYDRELLRSIQHRFGIHPLVIEDIEKLEQRTKLDVLDDALFLVLKLIYQDSVNKRIYVEQISIYVKENLLITFQERPKKIFDSLKVKILTRRGRIYQSRIDYLFYSLLDTIVDGYMDVLDMVNAKVEGIENNLMNQLSRDTLETIYDLKREMLYYRSSISPLKEIIIKLQKEEETHIIQDETLIYFKDLYDHVVQVNDTIDTYREMLTSFIDFYMMLNSNAMNEVMKTLTIISTIFIPLTFIAGLYGMNFDNMPEVNWKYGYFTVLGVMFALTIIMLLCFRRKNWF